MFFFDAYQEKRRDAWEASHKLIPCWVTMARRCLLTLQMWPEAALKLGQLSLWRLLASSLGPDSHAT